MLYGDIITDICSRCNDPLKDRLEQRAKDHFINAIYSIIDSGKYTMNDIPGYYKLIQDLVFTTNEYDLSNIDLYNIVEVFPDPSQDLDTTEEKVRISTRTIEEIKQMANNAQMRPSAEDMYIFRIGNTLYRKNGANVSTYESAGGNYYMAYVQNIHDDDWADTRDLSLSFSNNILRHSIDIASRTLLAEDEL